MSNTCTTHVDQRKDNVIKSVTSGLEAIADLHKATVVIVGW